MTKSTVLATLGTVNNRNQLLLTKLLEAVAGEDYQVLLALGDTPTVPDTVPRNVHVERYVPVSQAVSACAAVVSHAGRGTILTALSQGVPVCSIPLTADQPITASLIERFGAGLTCATGQVQMGPFALPVVDPEQLDPLQLRHNIRRVLTEPAFAQQARALQAEIAELPGSDQVVHLVESVHAEHARPARSTLAQSPPR